MGRWAWGMRRAASGTRSQIARVLIVSRLWLGTHYREIAMRKQTIWATWPFHAGVFLSVLKKTHFSAVGWGHGLGERIVVGDPVKTQWRVTTRAHFCPRMPATLTPLPMIRL